MSVDIRLGTPHEAWAIYLQTPEFDAAYIDEAGFVERLDRDDALILIATRSNSGVAFKVGYDRYSDGSFYSWLGSVLPAARGERLASRLIEVQEQRVRALGYHSIYVKTRNKFVGMRITLARSGYEIVGFDLPSDVFTDQAITDAELVHRKALL